MSFGYFTVETNFVNLDSFTEKNLVKQETLRILKLIEKFVAACKSN